MNVVWSGRKAVERRRIQNLDTPRPDIRLVGNDKGLRIVESVAVAGRGAYRAPTIPRSVSPSHPTYGSRNSEVDFSGKNSNYLKVFVCARLLAPVVVGYSDETGTHKLDGSVMINPERLWTFTAHHALRGFYDHVRLLPARVLGRWFCVDRRDGRALWERRHGRPDSVVGIGDDMIVAAEMTSAGMWTGQLGCYGISLATGELRWTSHANGWWGRVLRGLDFLPFFSNELRDAPIRVEGLECTCASGRVLDVRTGRQVRRIPRENVPNQVPAQTDVEQLYAGKFLDVPTAVLVSEELWLSHPPSHRQVPGDFALHARADDGTVRWRFDLRATGYHMSDQNYFAYRYVRPFVYIVVSEEPCRRPHPTQEHYVVPNPTFFHLLVVDARNGVIIQDIRLGDRRREECRIEDVDDRSILMSAGLNVLWLFERSDAMATRTHD